ncbi:host attachment protein [Methylobacterium sp. CM6257]|jgi:protein required for attachment to host cells
MSDTLPLMIPRGGYVVVGDGRRALVLRNDGPGIQPCLRVQKVFEAAANPPTHEQGTDRPPRVRTADRRSAIEQADWHEMAEHRFTGEVAAALGRTLDPVAALVIVAPPRTLAALRHALPEPLKRAVIAEVAKDLTKHPVSEIQRQLCSV